MSFGSEYIPPIEQETSAFAKNARAVFRLGFSKYERWTIDREREMALVFVTSGREPESYNHDLWLFADRAGYYSFSTDCLSKHEVSTTELSITYMLGAFKRVGPYGDPSALTLLGIKEALSEYKDGRIPPKYASCRVRLIDSQDGREI